MPNLNCLFVHRTGYNPFQRCQYCERKVADCFGFQFITISLMIIGLVISVLLVSDLPALVLDILIVIIILIGLLSYLASKESNEITLNKVLLEKMNRELEESVKQRTDDLKAINDKLIKTDLMKNELIGVINHELKTPLTCIISGVEVIKARGTEKFDESQRKLMGVIDKSGQDMLKLTNDLLDFSKIESGKIVLYPENIPVINLIEEVVQGLTPEANKRNVKINSKIHDKVSTIYADPERFKQILFALIDNAIKYSNEGGSVDISVSANGNNTVFEIKDSGIGIKPENLPNIFEKFAKRAVGHKGTGLGLYIARSFLRSHNGNIKVASEYGKGSTFTINIPKP